MLQAYRDVAYHPLNNVAAFQRVGLARLRRQKPKFFSLNDNFGERPGGPSVALAARFLEDWFSRPSRFEKRDKR